MGFNIPLLLSSSDTVVYWGIEGTSLDLIIYKLMRRLPLSVNYIQLDLITTESSALLV